MTYPYTQLVGNANVTVTATAAAAVDGSVSQKHTISLGLPVIQELAGLLHWFKIERTRHLNGSLPAYKITHNGSDLEYGLTFAAQGVHDGDALVIADV